MRMRQFVPTNTPHVISLVCQCPQELGLDLSALAAHLEGQPISELCGVPAEYCEGVMMGLQPIQVIPSAVQGHSTQLAPSQRDPVSSMPAHRLLSSAPDADALVGLLSKHRDSGGRQATTVSVQPRQQQGAPQPPLITIVSNLISLTPTSSQVSSGDTQFRLAICDRQSEADHLMHCWAYACDQVQAHCSNADV